MHHRSRVKLVVLATVAVGSALAASLAACSLDIDGTASAPTDSGPPADVTTPKQDSAPPVDAAEASVPDVNVPDVAPPPDAAPDAAADAGPDAADTGADGGAYAGNMAGQFTGDPSGFVNADRRVVQDDFTLEAWIYPTSISTTTTPGNGNQLFDAYATSGNDNGDWLSTLYTPAITPTPVADFITGFKNGSADSLGVTSQKIVPNVWQHLAIVRQKSSGQVLFYFNGTLLVNTINASMDTLDSIDFMNIGGGLTGGGHNGFVGLIDEVRVWNYQRTGVEIAGDQVDQLSAASIADSGLVLYYRFDETTNATTTVDASKSNLDGTVMGGSGARPTFVPVTGR
jgi:hypothetical protein